MTAPQSSPAPDAPESAGDSLLRVNGITKQFGDLLADDDVSFGVGRGEVVAVLGENGAGKSTLMRILYGLASADSGTVELDGRLLDLSSPRAAMSAGIGMVTQELSLVEPMTVTENVALSAMPRGRVDLGAARQKVVDSAERVGITIDPDAMVSSLSIGERQRVEIVKALFHDCRLLILDEPTAVLVPSDVEALFAAVRRLTAMGLGVLFVSHKLREVAEISDRVVVLRRGRVVAQRRTEEVDARALASLMMGAAASPTSEAEPSVASTVATAVGLEVGPPETSAEKSPAAAASTASVPAATALQVRGLSLEREGVRRLDDITLSVAAGEIVGIAGISGNGQTDLVDVLGATVRPDSGRILVGTDDVTGLDVAGRISAGLGRLTEDRRGSLVPTMSVEENLVLEEIEQYVHRGLLRRREIRAHAEEMIERFAIKARPTDAVATLSGGTMQKVLLARALSRSPRALVVAQPTRGLDVGAFRYVHERLRETRDRGAGVLVISEDLDELFGLCDRLAVMFRGRLVGGSPVAEASVEEIGMLMAGAAT